MFCLSWFARLLLAINRTAVHKAQLGVDENWFAGGFLDKHLASGNGNGSGHISTKQCKWYSSNNRHRKKKGKRRDHTISLSPWNVCGYREHWWSTLKSEGLHTNRWTGSSKVSNSLGNQPSPSPNTEGAWRCMCSASWDKQSAPLSTCSSLQPTGQEAVSESMLPPNVWSSGEVCDV